jgi:hypothetical protein
MQRQGFFVRALGAQRIKHIGQRKDACNQRDVFALGAARVAGAVALFMVGGNDGVSAVEPTHARRYPRHAVVVRPGS